MFSNKSPLTLATLALLAAALVLSGCGSPAPAPTSPTSVSTEVQAAPTTATGGYPSPITPTPFDYSLDEGYPAPPTTSPAVELPEALEIPQPEDDSGVVTGQMLTPGPGGEPYFGALYLANTVEADQEGFPPIVSFSQADAPAAIQDKTGRFLFTDIQPGKYALVIWNPVASTVIEDQESNDYLVFEVKAGETTDLGVIPIP